MIVNRQVYKVKAGCMEEAVAMLVALREQGPREQGPRTSRIYMSKFGPFATVVLEIEHETLAEYEKMWAGWSASPEGLAAFKEKWDPLMAEGGPGVNEIWTLVE